MESSNVQSIVNLEKIKQQVVLIITRPADFFRAMPVSGGFTEPMVFLAVIGAITGIINFAVKVFNSLGAALALLVLTPLLVPLFAFIGAAIAFVIWKLLGSSQNYETSYRCVAYLAAISPITAVISLIPYLGGIITAVWGFFLAVIVSTAVHQIARKKAQLVFGILFALIALSGISAEVAARKMEKRMEAWSQEYTRDGEMTPEQAGKMFGEFMKAAQEAAEKETKKSE